MKRPSRTDVAILDAAIDEILPEIERWADGEDVSDARDILRRILGRDGDAYVLAREFEHAGWTPDFSFVEFLDDADSIYRRVYADAIRKWVASGVKPRLTIGAHVTLPPGLDASADGEVTAINPDGTYTVFVPSFGHVREGLGIHGRIFTWEALERDEPTWEPV